MQTPLAIQPRQSLTPVAKGNEGILSAFSPMHNVVPRKRNMERCKPFFVSPLCFEVGGDAVGNSLPEVVQGVFRQMHIPDFRSHTGVTERPERFRKMALGGNSG